MLGTWEWTYLMDKLFYTGLQAPHLKLDSNQLVGAHDGRAGLFPVLLQWPSASLHRREAPRVLNRSTEEKEREEEEGQEEAEKKKEVNNHWD